MEWTGARYADTPTAQVEVTIDAPPERIWDVIADPLLMPRFSEELQSVEWVDDSSSAGGRREVEVGARFVGTNRHPSIGEWSTVSSVVECDRPERFAWAVGDPGLPAALWRFTLSLDGRGTRLAQWMQLGPGRSGLSLAIDARPDKEQQLVFVRMREHEEHMHQTLMAIRDLLERPS